MFFSQVGVSTPYQCPTLIARAPVKPVSPSHWSCPRKAPSPMEPTLPPPWKKVPPRLGKFGLSFSLLVCLVFFTPWHALNAFLSPLRHCICVYAS